MDRIKALVITPYEGMAVLVDEIAKRRSELRIDNIQGNLNTMNSIIRHIEETHPDFIVARGLVADKLSGDTAYPVTKIEFSGFDILSAIRMAQESKRRFAIVGFGSIISGAEMICNLLNITVPIVTTRNNSDIVSTIAKLKADKYDLIIGGTLASRTAESLGLGGILITSSIESIEAAINHGINIYTAYSNIVKKTDLLRAYLDSTGNELYIAEENGNIIYNSVRSLSLDDLSGIYTDVIFGRNIDSLIQSNGNTESRLHIQGKLISYNGNKAVAISITRTVSDNHTAGISISNNDEISFNLPDIAYKNSRICSELIKRAEALADTESSIVIRGEYGTEGDDLSKYVFKTSERFSSFFITIDSSGLKSEDIIDLKRNHSSILNSKATIYVKNPNVLTEKLSADIADLRRLGCRIIYSCIGSNTDYTGFLNRLASAEKEIEILEIPPLRTRIDDAMSLITIMIASLNVEYGNKIIGLDESASKLLSSEKWEGNVEELRYVIKKAVFNSKGYYISDSDLVPYIKEYRELYIPARNQISLEGSLSDITKKIIMAVLQEEGNSKIRTAERLHISRSKLWTILKEIDEDQKADK